MLDLLTDVDSMTMAGFISPQSEICIPKSNLDGRPAPAHMKLGAKWVEVRTADQTESNSKMKSEFETWPATPVEASLAINELTLLNGLVGVLLSNKRSSRGRPAIQVARGQKSEVSSDF